MLRIKFETSSVWLERRQVKRFICVMKHGHLMNWTVDLRPILSLRSTHVTRETGDINGEA